MRLIDADALLAAYDAEHEGTPGRARELIEAAPTVEQKRGLWIMVAQSAYLCSECGCIRSHVVNFCETCGAKMIGVTTDG